LGRVFSYEKDRVVNDEIFQVIGHGSGQIETYRWVVATYAELPHANRHADFMNELLEKIEDLDGSDHRDAHVESLRTKIAANHPYDPGFPKESGAHVEYTVEAFKVLSKDLVDHTDALLIDALRGLGVNPEPVVHQISISNVPAEDLGDESGIKIVVSAVARAASDPEWFIDPGHQWVVEGDFGFLTSCKDLEEAMGYARLEADEQLRLSGNVCTIVTNE
jgi:hypothetical protein